MSQAPRAANSHHTVAADLGHRNDNHNNSHEGNDGDDVERNAAGAVKLNLTAPPQVSRKNQRVVRIIGRIGWMAKGVFYGILGGLTCQSAVGDDPSGSSTSPQGVFILVGSNAVGIPLLVVLGACLCFYIIWRFWEGSQGQGYDRTFSAKKNFFKFRISPCVSGCVYTGYLAYLLQLIVKIATGKLDEETQAKNGNSFPTNWAQSTIGRVGLAIIGIAFTIAVIIQLQGIFLTDWHRDYRQDLPPRYMRPILVLGHLGFLGRAGVFLTLAILFYKQAGGEATPTNQQTVANALNQLRTTGGGKFALFVMGFLLIIYAAFAELSALVARVYPTPPPSRLPVMRDGEEDMVSNVQGTALVGNVPARAVSNIGNFERKGGAHRPTKPPQPENSDVRVVMHE